MGYEKCLEFLKTRRSIRKFKPKPVSEDLIFKILDVARYAPSAGNRQPWEFIIVKDKEKIKKLAEVHPWAKPLLGAPVAIVVIGNQNISPISYHVDCANTTIYIMLAAYAYGLGTVWIQTLRNIEEIREILNLPQNMIPISILAVGWPDEKPTVRPRKPLKELVHIDTYGNKLKEIKY